MTKSSDAHLIAAAPELLDALERRCGMHEKLKAIMKAGQGYTWGQLMKSLGGNSSVTERILNDSLAAGYLQEVNPIDGVNRSFRINQ